MGEERRSEEITQMKLSHRSHGKANIKIFIFSSPYLPLPSVSRPRWRREKKSFEHRNQRWRRNLSAEGNFQLRFATLSPRTSTLLAFRLALGGYTRASRISTQLVSFPKPPRVLLNVKAPHIATPHERLQSQRISFRQRRVNEHNFPCDSFFSLSTF